MNIYKKIIELTEKNVPSAVATIISTEGSTPRDVGAKMVVQFDGAIFGTVGGGAFEMQVIKKAKEVIKTGKPIIYSYDLTTEESGMVCGGIANVYIEPVSLTDKILILGAGHVGKMIAKVCVALELPYTIIDDRQNAGEIVADIENADLRIAPYNEFAEKVDIDERTYTIISTASHLKDQICLKEALKTKTSYIGMLASKTKRAEVYDNLHKENIFPEKDARVFSPVGISIKENTPAAIAISIIAQIYQFKTGVLKRDT